MAGVGAFGSTLRAARAQCRLTQEQLAERASLSVRAVRGLESGRVRRPRRDTALLLADALKLDGAERTAFLDAAAATPPAVTGPPAPAFVGPQQLPPGIAHFTGRAAELATLRAHLPADAPTNPALTISVVCGVAGVGKSALVTHFAHQVAARFPDGQLYVDLRGFDPTQPPLAPSEVLGRFLRGLGVDPRQVPLDLDELAAGYRTLVAGRRLVVVLDNAASADQVRPLLPGSASCLVLVTSRHRLDGLVARDGARQLSITSLEPADARVLLAGVLGADRVDDEPQAADELARLCGRLPLALRITAANLAARPDTTIADTVAALSTGDRLAQLAVAHDEPSDVGAAFDLSYLALKPRHQRLFRLLGLVPGADVTVPAAAALTGETVADTARSVEHLVAAHLLEPWTTGRYHLHDLLRCYAVERAAAEDGPAGVDAARRRLFDFALGSAGNAAASNSNQLHPPRPTPEPATVMETFPDEASAMAWLDAEHANLVSVVRYCVEHGPSVYAWQLAGVLRGFYWIRKHHAEWREAASAGLRAAVAAGDVAAQAVMHVVTGELHDSLGDHAVAAGQYRLAVERARACGWLDCEAWAHSELGVALMLLGDAATAIADLTGALAAHRAAGGSRPGEIRLLGALSAIQANSGGLREARDAATQLLEHHRAAGFRYGETVALGQLCWIYYLLGRPALSRDCLDRSARAFDEFASRHGRVASLLVGSFLDRDAGCDDSALRATTSALDIAREISDHTHEATALAALASLRLRAGDPLAAADAARECLRIPAEHGGRIGQLDALLELAAAQWFLGDPAGALASAHNALAMAERGGFRVQAGRALTALAELTLTPAIGQATPEAAARAVELAGRAMAIQHGTGHLLGMARALRTAARASEAAGDTSAAERHRARSAELYGALGVPDAVVARDYW